MEKYSFEINNGNYVGEEWFERYSRKCLICGYKTQIKILKSNIESEMISHLELAHKINL